MLAAGTLQTLLHLVFKGFSRVMCALQFNFKLVQLVYEVSEVLSSVLLLCSLELLVTFAEKGLKELRSYTILVEFVFLRFVCVDLNRFVCEKLLGVLTRVKSNHELSHLTLFAVGGPRLTRVKMLFSPR